MPARMSPSKTKSTSPTEQSKQNKKIDYWKSTSTKGKRTTTATEKLKRAKDRLTVGIWTFRYYGQLEN